MQFDQLQRREFIILLGGAAAWPLGARAQPHKGPIRLGFLPIGSPRNEYDRSLVEAFQEGLRRVGLIENQNIVLDIVWVGDDPDRAVGEALQRGAELLIPCGSGASVAAKRQTSIIPIVFLNVGDPIAMELVKSLSRPGGNATGFSDILAELSGKLVDVARELIKPHRIIHYLWHTAWPDGQNRYEANATGGPRRGNAAAIQWHCCNVRIGCCTRGNKDERLARVHCAAEPVHLHTPRSHYRVGAKEWAGDDFWLSGGSAGGRIGRVRS